MLLVGATFALVAPYPLNRELLNNTSIPLCLQPSTRTPSPTRHCPLQGPVKAGQRAAQAAPTNCGASCQRGGPAGAPAYREAAFSWGQVWGQPGEGVFKALKSRRKGYSCVQAGTFEGPRCLCRVFRSNQMATCCKAGPSKAKMVNLDAFWPTLVTSGLTWSALVTPGQTWSALVKHGQTWSALRTLG